MGRIESYNMSNCDKYLFVKPKKNVSDPKPHGVGDDETRLVDKRVDYFKQPGNTLKGVQCL